MVAEVIRLAGGPLESQAGFLQLIQLEWHAAPAVEVVLVVVKLVVALDLDLVEMLDLVHGTMGR